MTRAQEMRRGRHRAASAAGTPIYEPDELAPMGAKRVQVQPVQVKDTGKSTTATVKRGLGFLAQDAAKIGKILAPKIVAGVKQVLTAPGPYIDPRTGEWRNDSVPQRAPRSKKKKTTKKK